ncbi:MAG: site-specific DNA-methyltransferase, partial [Synergistaceae bacterium]|nr:site-specific DNA-methyltransferase [Synergistaceae bacterium]
MPTLNWLGKDKIVTHINKIPFHVLEHKYKFQAKIGTLFDDESENSGNKIIHGDNLVALKSLLLEYENKIKCIYIDPPYNTGNENWVYNDNVNDPRLKKWLGEVVGKEGEDLTRHDKWLCMMYPRLQLLKQLLSDDGAIFISIDDNEQANLKLICDEIFGANNFVAELVWNLGTGTTAGLFTRSHEYIFCYAKDKDNIKNFANFNSDETIRHGALKKISVKNPASEITFPAGFEFEGTEAVFTGEIGEAEKEYILSDEMRFKDGKLAADTTIRAGFAMRNQVESFIRGEKVFDSKGQPVKKFYFNKRGVLFYEKEKTIINPKTVLSDFGSTKNGTTILKAIFGDDVFSFPKPVELIKFLLQLASNPDSIILDSFAGIGTTAHAVLNLNQQDGG